MATTKEPIKWLIIDDFTPGIVSRRGPSSFFRPILGPKGSASVAGTFGCIASPAGHLIAGPGIVGGSGKTRPVAPSTVSRNAGMFIAGIFVNPNTSGAFSSPVAGQTVYPEVHVVLDYLDAAGGVGQVNRHMIWERYWGAALTREVIYSVSSLTDQSSAATSPPGFGVDWGMSRIGNLPILAMNWNEALGDGLSYIVPNNQFLGYFPDDAAPNVTGTHNIDRNNMGRMTTHGSRIIQFEVVPDQHGGGPLYVTNNEYVNYTDPAGSSTWPVQHSLYTPEENYGYGAFESVNAGELLLVKHRGGGVLISGDFNNPTVTRLPSVIGTGGYQTKGDATTIGFVYLTPHGAMAWRGADGSQLISDQIDPLFWLPGNQQSSDLNLCSNMAGSLAQVEAFGQFIFVTGGWIYDTQTKSWWYLDDPTASSYHYASSDGVNLFVSPAYLAVNKNILWNQYAINAPKRTYSWSSNLYEETTDRLVDVREVIVVAQGSGSGTDTVAVTVTDRETGASQAKTLTLKNDAYPHKYLISFNVATSMMQVRVDVDSGNTTYNAPSIQAIHIGYYPTTEVPETP